MYVSPSYEIELRAVISEDKYAELCSHLPSIMNLLNKESLHTRKFKKDGDDIRLRNSENRCEVVHKNGLATDLTRKELTINLSSVAELNSFATLLANLNFTEDAPWITHRRDFEHSFKNQIYAISLQHTENFAHILEVEFMAEGPEDEVEHEQNIREIISSLGCEPVNKEEFLEKIKLYGQAKK